jgi:hypothetical protein
MKSVAKAQQVPITRDDVGWRNFPEFEDLLSQEAPAPVLAKLEKTCRQLNDVIKSGSEEEKARATVAMTAYGRSLDLLRLLTEMRDRSADGK